MPGIYREDVTVETPVTIEGIQATVDATGNPNGFTLKPPAAGTTIKGFTIENAVGEGVLAPQHEQRQHPGQHGPVRRQRRRESQNLPRVRTELGKPISRLRRGRAPDGYVELEDRRQHDPR